MIAMVNHISAASGNPPRESGPAGVGMNVPSFSPWLYRYRNLVERFFSQLKHFRAIATRFEKHDANYLGLVKLAAAKIWIRFMSR